MSRKLTVKEAYLVMCEYLYKECELNECEEVDIRGLFSELELEGEWNSSDPGAIDQFEDAIELVVNGKSRFEFKK